MAPESSDFQIAVGFVTWRHTPRNLTSDFCVRKCKQNAAGERERLSGNAPPRWFRIATLNGRKVA